MCSSKPFHKRDSLVSECERSVKENRLVCLMEIILTVLPSDISLGTYDLHHRNTSQPSWILRVKSSVLYIMSRNIIFPANGSTASEPVQRILSLHAQTTSNFKQFTYIYVSFCYKTVAYASNNLAKYTGIVMCDVDNPCHANP